MVMYRVRVLKEEEKEYVENSTSPIQSAFSAANEYVAKCSKKNADIEVTDLQFNKVYYYKIVK